MRGRVSGTGRNRHGGHGIAGRREDDQRSVGEEVLVGGSRGGGGPIALAIAWNLKATVLTDSQAECRKLAAVSIGLVAARFIRKHPPESVHAMWTPSHAGLRENEVAHATSIGLLPNRAFLYRENEADDEASYSERPNAIRLARRWFPLPHKNLSREAHLIRRLQTDSTPTPDRLNTWHPSSYPYSACTHCGCERADAYHVVWACHKNPGLMPFTNPTTERWGGIRYAAET